MIYTTVVYKVLQKSQLSLVEYVVMDIIDALSNNDKYTHCTLPAEKIAELLCVNAKTISRVYTRLEDMGYVIRKNRLERRSSSKWKELVSEAHAQEDILSNTQKIKETKSPKQTDILSEQTDNLSVLYNNNIYNNNITLSETFGKSPHMRLFTLYSRMLHKKMNIRASLAIPVCLKFFKDMLKSDHEIVLGALLMAYFHYVPADRSGEWFANTSKSSAYPLGMFMKNINLLKSYLVNTKGMDLEDIDKVNEVVVKYVEGLTSD